MHPPSERELAIERAFQGAVDRLERSSDGGWRLVMADGARTILRARIVDDEWLVAVALYGWSAPSWWPLLRLNAGFDGCMRLTRACGVGLEVRGEIFIDADANVFPAEDHTSLCERVAGLCGDVVSAARHIVDERADLANGTTPVPSPDPETLLQMCRDAGWQASVLGSGHVQVTLDARAALCRATLSLEAGGRLRAVAPLTTSPGLSRESHDAIALLLLDASAHLRMVKGVALRQDDGEIAALSFAGDRQQVTAATLECALAALSVGCRAVGAEVQALEGADLAREYLAIRGWSRTDSVSPASVSEQEDTSCLQLP